MKVYEDRQLVVDDSLCEVLVVLHIEGHLSAGGVWEGAGEGPGGGQEGEGDSGGAHGGGEGGSGATKLFQREGPNSAGEQPVSHLEDRREGGEEGENTQARRKQDYSFFIRTILGLY